MKTLLARPQARIIEMPAAPVIDIEEVPHCLEIRHDELFDIRSRGHGFKKWEVSLMIISAIIVAFFVAAGGSYLCQHSLELYGG